MKRLLAFIIITAMLLTMTACGDGTETTTTSQTPTTVPSMVPSVEGQLYTELGVALEPYYRSGGVERNPWDIELYNGRLYVGSGDYDRNCGPIYVWCYDFEKKAFEIDTVLEDEQITRFRLIDGKLYVPGIDPKSGWDMGTYYVFDGKEWVTEEKLPNAAHNFDIVKYDGKLFAGIGAVSGASPILVTTDEETWSPLPLYRDGEAMDTSSYTYVRVYDLLTLNGQLYAYVRLSGSSTGLPAYMSFFRYDGDKFVHHSDLAQKLTYTKRNTYTHFHQNAEFKGRQYFSTGVLYRSSDMITAEPIAMDGDAEVNDLRVIGDKLYALCSEEVTADDGSVSFKNSLRVTTDGKTFTEVFSFEYPVRALSFTYGNGTVFLGMGFGKKAAKDFSYYDENGMILAINRVL